MRRVRALEVAWVPACAGMTVGARVWTERGAGAAEVGRCAVLGAARYPRRSAGMTDLTLRGYDGAMLRG